ncbi:hypothetical protein C0081_03495 [Cohaesibacter celericrescens]|uniref:Uncharacterized protein n=1 Tax=Cohaesibacter celericrescens TaxID=2067669 RepID=A0A2N5XVY6_9HYPH|nr:hypothetical protein C0081_03495 [Cohaesibacter celericrescens]
MIKTYADCGFLTQQTIRIHRMHATLKQKQLYLIHGGEETIAQKESNIGHFLQNLSGFSCKALDGSVLSIYAQLQF